MNNAVKPQPVVFTFDLFDTLITRNVSDPEDIFAGVGESLYSKGLWGKERGAFRKTRIAADKLTRRRLQTGEITLPQIYETLAAQTGWNHDETELALSIEVDAEIRAVRPIVEVRARWDALADHSVKAIVSDTYFSLEVISEMLRRCEIRCDDENLFLSSMLGARKSTGALFRIVVAKFDKEPGLIHHVGDNEQSDLKSAEREGLSAELYTGSGHTRFEREFRNPPSDQTFRTNGALRLARLSFPGGTSTERTLWEIGTQVAGPMLFSYVCWVLEAARKAQLDHLYFLARDGQILLQLAQKIDAAFHSSYLLASRQAWHLPSIVKRIDEKSLSWIVDGHAHSSLRNLLARVNVIPEEITDLLVMDGLDPGSWHKPIKDKKVLEKLFTEESLNQLVLNRAKVARDSISIYFADEGLLETDQIGIVDLGWNGRLQKSLFHLLDEAAPRKARTIDGFYFSLKQGSRMDETGRYHGYCEPEFAKHADQAMLMELFCSADHGGLLSFMRDGDGKIEPVLAQKEDRAVIAWGLPLFHRAILETADQLLKACNELNLKPVNVGRDLRIPSRAALALFVNLPSLEEAELFGRFPFTYDQKHEEVVEMAPKMSAGQALAMILPATMRAKPRTMWMQATLVRSVPGLCGLALLIFRWRDRLVHFLQSNAPSKS